MVLMVDLKENMNLLIHTQVSLRVIEPQYLRGLCNILFLYVQ